MFSMDMLENSNTCGPPERLTWFETPALGGVQETRASCALGEPVSRSMVVVQAPPGTAWPGTGSKVSRTNATSRRKPLCRGTQSSKTAPCMRLPPSGTRSLQALHGRAAARLRAAPPAQSQRRAKHPSETTAMLPGSESANRSVRHSRAAADGLVFPAKTPQGGVGGADNPPSTGCSAGMHLPRPITSLW